jgi:hypothetical protein
MACESLMYLSQLGGAADLIRRVYFVTIEPELIMILSNRIKK